MSAKTFFGWLLKAPLILLNLATLGVGIYAAMGYVPGFLISWGAPGIIGGLLISYAIGTYMLSSEKKNRQEMSQTDQEQYAEVPQEEQ